MKGIKVGAARAAIISLVVVTLAAMCAAQSSDAFNEDPLDRAARAFANSDWPTAIQNYVILTDRGIADPALYYNLGAAYAHEGQRGRAIWMLIRAKRLAPRDRDIRHNLNLLAPDLASQMAVFPILPLEALYGTFSLNEWTAIAGVATALSGLFLALMFRIPKGSGSRIWLKRLSVVAVALALTAHSFSAIKYYSEAYSSRGVVVATGTVLHAAPSPSSDVYNFSLPPGTVIGVEDAGVRGWIKAVYGGRSQVFIQRDRIELL